MRRIVLLGLFALLVANGASAQRRGGFAPAFGRGGFGLNRGRMAYPYGSGGYGYSSYDTGGYYGYLPQPVFLIQQPPPPPVFQPPPRPAHSVIADYKWPGLASSTLPEAETQTFGIVLKDGSMLAATTVMAADDVLHYVDPDERHMRISMRDVDRAATMKLNRERKLNLYLPASPR